MRFNRTNESENEVTKNGMYGVLIAISIMGALATIGILGVWSVNIKETLLHLLPVALILIVAAIIISPVKRVESDSE